MAYLINFYLKETTSTIISEITTPSPTSSILSALIDSVDCPHCQQRGEETRSSLASWRIQKTFCVWQPQQPSNPHISAFGKDTHRPTDRPETMVITRFSIRTLPTGKPEANVLRLTGRFHHRDPSRRQGQGQRRPEGLLLPQSLLQSSPFSFQRGALRARAAIRLPARASSVSGCGKVLEPGDVDDIEVALSTRKSDLDVMHQSRLDHGHSVTLFASVRTGRCHKLNILIIVCQGIVQQKGYEGMRSLARWHDKLDMEAKVVDAVGELGTADEEHPRR